MQLFFLSGSKRLLSGRFLTDFAPWSNNPFLPYPAFVDIDGFSSMIVGDGGCVCLDTTSQRPFPGTQFTEIAVIGFMHSLRDLFRLLPGFVPVAARFHSGNRPV